MGAVRLERMEPSNWRRALEVRVGPDQLELVADYEPVALVILAKCYLCPGGLIWEPFGILEGDTWVGVVALAHSETRCDMVHFVIDRAQQGRGLGKAGVGAIIAHVRRELPGCRALTLTANPRNERAQHVYASFGFDVTGETRDDEPVWQLDLTG